MPRAIHLIDKGGHERALATQPRTSHDEQAFGLAGQCLDFTRDPELLGGDRSLRHDAEHASGPAMVAETQTAYASEVGELRNPFACGTAPQRFRTALRHQSKQQRL